MSLSLNKIFAHAGRDLLIRELTLDSRNVRAGDLFLAVPGGKVDGRAHIADALQRGAAAVAFRPTCGIHRQRLGLCDQHSVDHCIACGLCGSQAAQAHGFRGARLVA